MNQGGDSWFESGGVGLLPHLPLALLLLAAALLLLAAALQMCDVENIRVYTALLCKLVCKRLHTRHTLKTE